MELINLVRDIIVNQGFAIVAAGALAVALYRREIAHDEAIAEERAAHDKESREFCKSLDSIRVTLERLTVLIEKMEE